MDTQTNQAPEGGDQTQTGAAASDQSAQNTTVTTDAKSGDAAAPVVAPSPSPPVADKVTPAPKDDKAAKGDKAPKPGKSGKGAKTESRDPTRDDLIKAPPEATIPVIWCFPGNPSYAVGRFYPIGKKDALAAIDAGRARLATADEIARYEAEQAEAED